MSIQSSQSVPRNRASGRAADELRPVHIERDYIVHAHGSVLVAFGDTRVICTATVEDGVPRFLRGSRQGWVTAEYGMLPGATHSRADREAVRGKQSGRSMEIQRLIGRSLRACIDRKRFGERTLRIDCDVLQADGGTRCAAITGACVAMRDALARFRVQDAFTTFAAAVSVGVWQGQAILDLDYAEDSAADIDMNLVMLASGGLVEVQSTAEGTACDRSEFLDLLTLAERGATALIAVQKAA